MDTHVDKVWTYDDLAGFPSDGQKYEIFDGELVVSPAPTFFHQLVLKRLLLALIEQIEKRGAGWAHFAPLDVVLSDKRVVQPDVFVIAADQRKIIKHRAIEGAPVLAMEILSPSNRTHDRVRKRRFYARAGIREYWIIDPDDRTIEVLSLKEGGLTYITAGWYASGDRAESIVFPGVGVSVDEMLAPLDPPK